MQKNSTIQRINIRYKEDDPHERTHHPGCGAGGAGGSTTTSPFTSSHALTVEGVMRWYAQQLGYGDEADFWATVGLLHDIDFEQWPEEHCSEGPGAAAGGGLRR